MARFYLPGETVRIEVESPDVTVDWNARVRLPGGANLTPTLVRESASNRWHADFAIPDGCPDGNGYYDFADARDVVGAHGIFIVNIDTSRRLGRVLGDTQAPPVMEEKPVWMQAWHAEVKGVFMPARVYTADGEVVAEVLGGSRRESFAALLAAAPALMRALLLAEWPYVEADEGCVGAQCQGCEAICGPHIFVHLPDCPVDVVLTAAGFPDQASRDAARERMRGK